MIEPVDHDVVDVQESDSLLLGFDGRITVSTLILDYIDCQSQMCLIRMMLWSGFQKPIEQE